MKRTVIYSDAVARGAVPLAHAVSARGLVFVSGIPPFMADGTVARGDFPAQMRQCLRNVGLVLEAAGASFADVLKVNVYVADISHVPEMNALYTEAFGEDAGEWPARTTIAAVLPREDFLLEIECIAMTPKAD